MICSIKEDMIDKGLSQIMFDKTRDDSTLDHIYVNNFSKLNKVYSDANTSSDHSAIFVERNMKIIKSEETYVKTRSWKNINYEKLNQDIINSDEYSKLL